MTQLNHQVTSREYNSREYKLMLNVDRFRRNGDHKQAVAPFWRLIKFLVTKQGGTIEDQGEEERRVTWYMDTGSQALRQHGFSLRVREGKETKKYQVNLKYRGPDRYLSAAQDVSSPLTGKFRFEEDILPPFTSRFAKSTSIQMDSLPNLTSMGGLIEIFSGLKSLNISNDTPVQVVNGFKAHETALRAGKPFFGTKQDIKASLSFWYLLGEEDELPMIGEFSFDYSALKGEDGNLLVPEQFPTAVVEGTNRFFLTLQNQTGWLNLNLATKTAFALDSL